MVVRGAVVDGGEDVAVVVVFPWSVSAGWLVESSLVELQPLRVTIAPVID